MRDSLTVLAILLIAVLTAALVGPYFVDWNAHRALIEHRLSKIAGAPVTVAGPIELKLLPKPVLRLGAVAVGAGSPAGPYGAIAGGPRLSAEEVDAELSLPALLRGEVQIVDATLQAPHLDLAQAPDGQLVLPRLPAGEADRVAIEHLGLRDGSVSLRLSDGLRLALSNINLDGEATTLRGPFKAAGSVGGIPLRLAAGALDRGRMRVKLRLDGAGTRAALDLDGTVALGASPAGFDGTLAAVGALPLDGSPATVPWRATAQVKANTAEATLTDVEVRAGTDLRAVIADGSGTLARGTGPDAVPDIAVHLHGAGLDVDSLAVAPEGSATAPPRGMDLLGLLARIVGARVGDAPVPARLALDASFDTATIAGRTLLGADARLGLGPDPGAAVSMSTSGPDGAHLSLDGRVAPGPVFQGRATAAAADLPRVVAWLKPIAPGLADWLAAAVPGRTIAISGDVKATDGKVAASNLTLRLDGSRFAGSLAYGRAEGATPPKVTADLRADSLDLDALPDLRDLAAGGADLDLALASRAVRLSGMALGATAGLLEAGPIALHLVRSGDDLKLDRLSLALDGAMVEATASRTGSSALAEARVDAPHLGPLAALVARLFPGPVASALVARASALSPFEGTLRAEAAAAPNTPLVPTRFALDGTAGGTRLAATLTPDGPGADVASRPVTLTLHAAAPEAAVPLRQLGLVSATDGAIGPARVDATAKGSFVGGFAMEAQAAFGSTTLSYAGRGEAARGAGRIALVAADLRPLLAGLGTTVAAGGTPIPAAADGDIDWSDAKMTLSGLTAHVVGTAAKGDIAVDLAPRQPGGGGTGPRLSGRLSLDHLPAATLLSLGLGAPSERPTGNATVAGGVAPAWSSAPFGAPPNLPQGEVKLAVDHMPLLGALEARDVALTLRSTRGGVTLDDGSAKLGGGTIRGALDLRRDGTTATTSGHVLWSGLNVDLGDLSGRIGGDLRFAGAGGSPAALVASLGGTGDLTLTDASLARTDPDAPSRTAAAFTPSDPLAEPDPNGVDAGAVGRRLADELDRGSLHFARETAPAVLVGGVLRVGALMPDHGTAATTDIALDLDQLALSLRTRLAPQGTVGARGIGGGGVVVAEAGPIEGALKRDVDAAGLVARLQAQAVARAQDRIDVFEQDIRERAYFNRQLKAMQADQQAARDRAAAQAASAKAAADASAKGAAEAKRIDDAQARARDARMQAEFEAAARSDAARAEAEKRLFIDKSLKGLDPGPVGSPPNVAATPFSRSRHLRPHDPVDLLPPPSIMDERAPTAPPRN